MKDLMTLLPTPADWTTPPPVVAPSMRMLTTATGLCVAALRAAADPEGQPAPEQLDVHDDLQDTLYGGRCGQPADALFKMMMVWGVALRTACSSTPYSTPDSDDRFELHFIVFPEPDPSADRVEFVGRWLDRVQSDDAHGALDVYGDRLAHHGRMGHGTVPAKVDAIAVLCAAASGIAVRLDLLGLE